ncbi:MAG: hypothetical protein Hyperionvirus5_115 [Hyperionvirus sp.]|uniref:Uncharacterized protein n=1 Tax=Hyperionvirus sp. TaxID=2487770 RepID=A0A3G5AD64_9VIRU|nr:MAG: hypothetical protein Hyperionvirus5_115 [Hyperionvirus sp.]
MSETFSSENDKLHVSEDTNTIIYGPTKKKWIRLPKELGGIKANVIDSYQTICQCGKHVTTVYILKAKFSTMFCDTKGQWAWLMNPNEQSLKTIKASSQKAIEAMKSTT